MSTRTAENSAPSRGKTWANITVGLMVLIGLYWLGIAGCQLVLIALPDTDSNLKSTLAITAIWNVVVSVLNLLFIRDIRRRRQSVRVGLGFLAVVGTLWAMFGIMQGAWLQIPAVIMYVSAGVLLWVNRNYYTESSPRKVASSPAVAAEPAIPPSEPAPGPQEASAVQEFLVADYSQPLVEAPLLQESRPAQEARVAPEALAVQPTEAPSAVQPAAGRKRRWRSNKVPLFVGGGCLGSIFLCAVAGLIVYGSGVLGGSPRKVDTDAAFSPDGSQIAFTSLRKGNYDIFVINADGTHLRQLTSQPLARLSAEIDTFTDYAPTWSPDGKQIAFATARENLMMGYVDWTIYTMNADGSNPQLFLSGAVEPAWSPDGRWMALVTSGQSASIYVEPAQSGSGGGLPVSLFPGAAVSHPSWSPDGKRLVFAKRNSGEDFSEIYVMGADGSGLTQLTDMHAWSTSPVWSPDGQAIAFDSNREVANIYTIAPDGTGLAQLTHDAGDNAYPDWSPDGRRIVFSSSRLGNDQAFIFIMDADGSNVVQLTK